jgi:rare lipoprotein A
MKMFAPLYFLGIALFLPDAFGQQHGIASYYGPGFHGKLTASGTVYNQHGNSCAHRTLPLGTKITVTNLSNGKTSRTVVNDRGPYVPGRILDMSIGLKQAIGCGDLCKVKIS